MFIFFYCLYTIIITSADDKTLCGRRPPVVHRVQTAQFTDKLSTGTFSLETFMQLAVYSIR